MWRSEGTSRYFRTRKISSTTPVSSIRCDQEQQALDRFIATASENWKIGRITYVDKNILRVAVYEMLYSPEVPPKVAIDEALELAKKFGAEDSKDFINGILDRILRIITKGEKGRRHESGQDLVGWQVCCLE